MASQKIEIAEQTLTKDGKIVGKIAVLRGGLNSENPEEVMNNAVSKYVESTGYNDFVEIFLDNPWVRVIVGGINELDYKEFTNQKLQW
jgi:hypothetical protein